jgi:hypothetical protein
MFPALEALAWIPTKPGCVPSHFRWLARDLTDDRLREKLLDLAKQYDQAAEALDATRPASGIIEGSNDSTSCRTGRGVSAKPQFVFKAAADPKRRSARRSGGGGK